MSLLQASAPGIVVFSGGSAANTLVDVFNEISKRRSCQVDYVIPISDNGGSSSELMRVFGGPGIGDIRSRLVRLIPPSHAPIYRLLNHRLPISPELALAAWQEIVSGVSPLWLPIPPPQRELIRSVLLHLNLEILKRARPPSSTFTFSIASIGNLFLTGARLFTGSFESAIYLMRLVGGIPDAVGVIPGVNSNFSHHISAGLEDGSVITGQNAISHPSAPSAMPEEDLMPLADESHPEDAHLPGSLPTLRTPNILFSKHIEEDLPSRITRIWYINPYGQEISPVANPKAITTIRKAEAVVYSIGSLYTSIVPCLILRGVGEAVATTSSLRWKILILNGTLDRETGPMATPMTATDFVAAIARAAEESCGRMGKVDSSMWSRYVTHLVFMEGDRSPKVDKQTLARAGIECVLCSGKKDDTGSARYDESGLTKALENILGRPEGKGDES